MTPPILSHCDSRFMIVYTDHTLRNAKNGYTHRGYKEDFAHEKNFIKILLSS
jgi:hypothetical protein